MADVFAAKKSTQSAITLSDNVFLRKCGLRIIAANHEASVAPSEAATGASGPLKPDDSIFGRVGGTSSEKTNGYKILLAELLEHCQQFVMCNVNLGLLPLCIDSQAISTVFAANVGESPLLAKRKNA